RWVQVAALGRPPPPGAGAPPLLRARGAARYHPGVNSTAAIDPTAIADPHALRQLFRGGLDVASTARLAPGRVQGNVVILPAAFAADFEAYCRANAQACPLLGRSAVGDALLPALGRDFDVRTDLPRYRVWRDGEIAGEPQDIRSLWRDDLVAFVLGCSYSFEQALIEGGIRLRHWDRGQNPPYYRTSVDTTPAGPFSGK